MTSALQRRLEALEDAYGGGRGCDRCRGTLVIVEDAITGLSTGRAGTARTQVRRSYKSARHSGAARDAVGR
jgi:hypothetical protein